MVPQDIDTERKIIEVQEEFRGERCIGLQIDMVAMRGASISFAAINWTHVVRNDRDIFHIVDTSLDFIVFPYTSHIHSKIHEWFINALSRRRMKPHSVAGVSLDGESAGQRAIADVGDLDGNADTCDLH